ncbi:uncharacterized protein IUM83_01809 [Phytophthora cinnamomi]|uniref:uncharacterized protein n=1 Tax=Phytophthora cinnamomi TaxID=4785 RepID=UPI0035596249|nr:hypothetical protein IUM83_01809 [Phytophthora cinnamomi]
MVVIQGPHTPVRQSPRLTKTLVDAGMARTKVTTVAQTAGPVAKSQPANQTQRVTVTTPAGGANPSQTSGSGRQENKDEGKDEETKQNDAVNDGNSDNEHETRDTGDAADEVREPADNDSSGNDTMTPVAVLTAALQQVAATMARIDARLDQLGTTPNALTSTGSDGSRQTTTETARTAPTARSLGSGGTQQPRAAGEPRRQVVHRPHDRDDSRDDGDEDDDNEYSSSSDGDDDSDASNDGGDRCGLRQPATLQGDRDFQRIRRRTIRDLDLPTFLPTPQTSVMTWIARVDLALQGARLSGRGDWTGHERYYILGNKLQDSAARWWVELDR